MYITSHNASAYPLSSALKILFLVSGWGRLQSRLPRIFLRLKGRESLLGRIARRWSMWIYCLRMRGRLGGMGLIHIRIRSLARWYQDLNVKVFLMPSDCEYVSARFGGRRLLSRLILLGFSYIRTTSLIACHCGWSVPSHRHCLSRRSLGLACWARMQLLASASKIISSLQTLFIKPLLRAHFRRRYQHRKYRMIRCHNLNHTLDLISVGYRVLQTFENYNTNAFTTTSSVSFFVEGFAGAGGGEKGASA